MSKTQEKHPYSLDSWWLKSLGWTQDRKDDAWRLLGSKMLPIRTTYPLWVISIPLRLRGTWPVRLMSPRTMCTQSLSSCLQTGPPLVFWLKNKSASGDAICFVLFLFVWFLFFIIFPHCLYLSHLRNCCRNVNKFLNKWEEMQCSCVEIVIFFLRWQCLILVIWSQFNSYHKYSSVFISCSPILPKSGMFTLLICSTSFNSSLTLYFLK